MPAAISIRTPVSVMPRPRDPAKTHAPFRIENQAGGTIGGPILKNKFFFFGSVQRWWDRQLGAGVTIVGVPTEAGRQITAGTGRRSSAGSSAPEFSSRRANSERSDT